MHEPARSSGTSVICPGKDHRCGNPDEAPETFSGTGPERKPGGGDAEASANPVPSCIPQFFFIILDSLPTTIPTASVVMVLTAAPVQVCRAGFPGPALLISRIINGWVLTLSMRSGILVWQPSWCGWRFPEELSASSMQKPLPTGFFMLCLLFVVVSFRVVPGCFQPRTIPGQFFLRSGKPATGRKRGRSQGRW
jgi:hypothetical protein